MPVFTFRNKAYEVDEDHFLLKREQWDEDFAEGMAPHANIPGGLTPAHWDVIHFIRKTFMESNRCPMVHETCRALRLRTSDLSRLFPTGYLRGACKLAGLSYRTQEVHPSWLPRERISRVSIPLEQRIYRVNIRGFLIDPTEWDEEFAVHKAQEMKMPGPLTDLHWQVIRFLRQQYETTGRVPTVYETCLGNRLEVDELGELFPDGYHRGAVKIAGLKAL